MKRMLLCLFALCLLSACKKEMPEPPSEVSSNSAGWAQYNEYSVTFFSTNFAGSPIAVSFAGDVQSITYAFNYYPNCGASGCANFTVPPGEYQYYYQSGAGNLVSGTIHTGASQCIQIIAN